MSFSLFSPAKVNLSLQILGKRSDGFHELITKMQTISLGDTLHFEESESDRLSSTAAFIPLNQDNLILKAKNLFSRKLGRNFYFKIHIDKKTPIEAGLGGGSSNAATTLFALNQYFSYPFSEIELAHMSEELGSDVPFFFSHGQALCYGRGEKIKETDEVLLPPFWIAKPNFGLSTVEVYRNVSLSERGAKEGRCHRNDLEKPAFLVEPRLKDIQQEFMDQGFSEVFLTGSGSALVLLGHEKLVPKSPLVQFFCVKPILRPPSSWYLDLQFPKPQ